ncbi:autotransporter outer membrane beta-barrel domain-containing protein [Stenotrophomonas sp. AB1(2024)]|uniref:autotransporter outer membrane beta-barrel domain-containing protein n=1 Tax=Stenotrophomonas sp. AB1(2024) TaxID=3132215 RepID=UPI0030B10C39
MKRRSIYEPGYNSTNRTFMIGLDAAIKDAGVLGAYLAHDNLDVDVSGDADRSDMTGWTGGLYGSWWSDRGWFLQSVGEYGQQRLESFRSVQFAGVDMQAQGNRGVETRMFCVSGGFNITPNGAWLIQCTLAARYEYVKDNAYTERGAAGLSVDYGPLKAEAIRSEGGVAVRRAIFAERGHSITVVQLYGGILYDAPLSGWDRTARLAMATEPFILAGDSSDHTGFRAGLGWAGLGLEHTWDSNMTLQTTLDVERVGDSPLPGSYFNSGSSSERARPGLRHRRPLIAAGGRAVSIYGRENERKNSVAPGL